MKELNAACVRQMCIVSDLYIHHAIREIPNATYNHHVMHTCKNLRENKQVVKVIWHKGTSPLQTNGSIVFSRWWCQWQIWLNLCFLWPTRVHIPNGKSIGSAVFTARRSYASAVLLVLILSVWLSIHLSVCHTRSLWLIQRTYRRYFYTTWKGNPSIFSDAKNLDEIPIGSPPTGAPNRCGVR